MGVTVCGEPAVEGREENLCDKITSLLHPFNGLFSRTT